MSNTTRTVVVYMALGGVEEVQNATGWSVDPNTEALTIHGDEDYSLATYSGRAWERVGVKAVAR